VNLGFLTVIHEASGYLGGYLVTNSWGRPLEFRLSTAVQPNRVQQILYAGTLESYLCADLIGKTLLEKTTVAMQLLVTDTEAVLDLRRRVDVPVLWLAPPDKGERAPVVYPATADRGPICCHPRFPGDAAGGRQVLDTLAGMVDLAEPFARIREAIGEARKMGVTNR
jgi:hypothetical protein